MAELYRDLINNYEHLDGSSISKAFALSLRIRSCTDQMPELRMFVDRTKLMLLSHSYSAYYSQMFKQMFTKNNDMNPKQMIHEFIKRIILFQQPLKFPKIVSLEASILISGMSFDSDFCPDILLVCLENLQQSNVQLFDSLCRLCDTALLNSKTDKDLELIQIALEKVTCDLL